MCIRCVTAGRRWRGAVEHGAARWWTGTRRIWSGVPVAAAARTRPVSRSRPRRRRRAAHAVADASPTFGTMTLSSSRTPVTMFCTWATTLMQGQRRLEAADDRRRTARRRGSCRGRRRWTRRRRARSRRRSARGRCRRRSATSRSVKVHRIPANAQITPDSTYSPNLIRLTRMPANRAASGCSPMAKIDRPDRRGVQHHAEDHRQDEEDADRPGQLGVRDRRDADVGQRVGKPVDRAGAPSMISASPRNSVSVPMVTAIDGSPSLGHSTPLSAPPTAPTSSTASIAGQIAQPCCDR